MGSKLRAVRNNILVKVDWEKRATVKHGTLELHTVDGYDSNAGDTGKYASENVLRQTRGVVVSLPLGFDPHYDIDRIAKEIELGDIVYFHPNSIDEDSLIEVDGERFFYVSYDMVFCVIRNGQPKMIGGRVLVDKYDDPDVKEININGSMLKCRVTASGLISEIDVRYSLNKGVLRHIGTPLVGEPVLDVTPGDVIYYQKDADFENEIEGHKYFVMTQEDIVAKQ